MSSQAHIIDNRPISVSSSPRVNIIIHSSVLDSVKIGDIRVMVIFCGHRAVCA